MDIKTAFNVGDEIHFMSGKTPKCLRVARISITVPKNGRKVQIEYYTEGEPIKKSQVGQSEQIYIRPERKCFATREELIANYTSKL
jgi:hypothetical protein